MKLTLDVDEMTMGDLEDFEGYCGYGIHDAFVGGDKPRSMKVMTALIWLAGRKENPAYTLEDARAVRLAEVEVDVQNPTLAGPSPMTKRARRAAS